MVATESAKLALGSEAPSFALPDPDGKLWSLDEFRSAPALVVAFICNHCPYVQNIREALVETANDLQSQGVAVVAVNSNDATQYPDDAPPRMAEEVVKFGYPFPYLVDETQEVAKAYRATCTPDVFVFDGERRLAYRGQFDSSRPGNNVRPTGDDLRRAVEAVLADQPVPDPQHPSIGCSIKWKSGNAPAYG